jgi:4-amino-4-deoxy-L-arabinose transferase-like glycosyltransferase
MQTMLSARALVLYIAAAKFFFHLATANRYGIFRDELYYLACAEHLDWGYVDQPPMIALLTFISTRLFGTSLLALRLLPALAGAALVWLTGMITRELGGGRTAQVLAGIAVALAPIYAVMHHWLTMNAFEPLIWMAAVWCIVKAINKDQPRYWMPFGILAGIGLQTKYSTAFFVIAVVIGLLATSERRALANRWFWIGALCAFLIFLPNLVWLVQHNFPFLELMANIRRTTRDIVRGPIAFVADQAMLLNPVTFPLWTAGLLWLFTARTRKNYRVLGWTYFALLMLFMLLRGKNYYLTPAYPMLFAAGGIAFERISLRIGRWITPAYGSLIIASGVALILLVSPILPVELYLKYKAATGLEPVRAENQPTGPLPQFFADEFGWEEMTREVARVYNALPPAERASTAIFANNYGEAGAIDFFGPRYGLPKVISSHQNYWLWGPGRYTGTTVIVLGSDGSGDRPLFKTVDVGGRVEHPYSRRDEQFDIFVCRGLKTDLRLLWPQIKKWN